MVQMKKVTRSGRSFREAMNKYLQDGTPYEVSAVKEMVSKLTTDHTSMEAGGRETRSFDEAKKAHGSDVKPAFRTEEVDEDEAELKEAVKTIAKLEAELAQLQGKAVKDPASPSTVSA